MAEALREEMNKSLKEIQGSTIKQMNEVNKTVQDLKIEIETIKETQTEGILEMENLGKRTGTTDTAPLTEGMVTENLRHKRYDKRN